MEEQKPMTDRELLLIAYGAMKAEGRNYSDGAKAVIILIEQQLFPTFKAIDGTPNKAEV